MLDLIEMRRHREHRLSKNVAVMLRPRRSVNPRVHAASASARLHRRRRPAASLYMHTLLATCSRDTACPMKMLHGKI